MMTILKHSFVAFSLLSLAACARTEAGLGPDNFGNSVRQNIAVQIVNPDAAENAGAPTYNGERAGLAQRRYVTDTAEKPTAPKTAGGGSGSN